MTRSSASVSALALLAKGRAALNSVPVTLDFTAYRWVLCRRQCRAGADWRQRLRGKPLRCWPKSAVMRRVDRSSLLANRDANDPLQTSPFHSRQFAVTEQFNRFRSEADIQRAAKLACDAGWSRASRSVRTLVNQVRPLVRPAPCDLATSPTATVYAPAQRD